MGNKRRRIALSCVDCRKRKVKCDRTYPSCLRCQKGGHPETCAYVPYEGAEPSELRDERDPTTNSWSEDLEDDWGYRNPKTARTTSNSATPHILKPSKRASDKSETIQRLEQKVLDLEARVEAAHSRESARTNMFAQQVLGMGIPTPASTVVHETTPHHAAELEQILLRGKSFKTQYYGPSNYGSILLQFSELSTFIKDVMAHMPSMSRYKAITDGPHKRQRQNETRVQAEASHAHSVLLGLIPERETADLLVQHYIDNFETTLRVLHVPSFLDGYEAFWRDPDETPSDFLVVLLLAMACVYCVFPQEPAGFVGRSSRRRETTTKWIAACDSWMQAQSQKHVTITTNQVHILLFLAKRVNCIKVKRGWTSVGQLLRLAMAAGLHREPIFLSSKISIFHQEMRRRLWATVLELDLLAAIDRGMPASITALDWDCQPPANIHDEDFGETSQALPPSKPYHVFTRTSYLCIALQSTSLRLEMLSVINRVKPTLTPELASKYDIKIRQAYADIPSWSFESEALLPRTLARLNLLEFINLIHQPFVVSQDDPSRHFFSRAASRDAAATMLELYRDLAATDRLILPFIRSDAFRAGLCLCYDLSTSTPADFVLSSTTQRATELLEHCLHMQQEKVMQLGQGFHAFWIASSALSLAYSKQSPREDPTKFAQQASDRVVRINDRIVALQEPTQDGQARIAIGDELLVEAQAVLNKRHMMPGRGVDGATATDPRVEPFADTQLDFDVFNMAEIWDLASFDDFGWV